jgi:hypothetical protein
MPKNYNKVKRKINKLTKDEEQKDNLVIQRGNTFHVYNEYKIVRDKHEFNIFVNNNDTIINTVYNSSSAISWCNAHKGNDTALANKIIQTDRALEHLSNDIAYTKILVKLKTTPHAKQSILFARLTEYVDKQIRLKLNLHKYIQRSKQLKNKGFSNEFTAPSTTKKFNQVR